MRNRKRHPLDQSPFYKLRSRKKLAEILRVDALELRRLSNESEALYTEFEVAKKDGGRRPVENPNRQLKLAQARIARLLGRILPPDYLFCPVKGRCYVSNTAQHRGQRVIRCLDIRKYFPNTSSRRVFWFFHKVMKCERDVSAVLSRIATYRGHLPTGSPLSPILSYFAHIDVWEEISTICKRENYTLTVYIDDVTVSGSRVTAKILWEIKRAIHRSGLRYHKEKKFVDRPAEVTGVIIARNSLTPANRQLKKRFEFKEAIRKHIASPASKKIEARLTGLEAQIKQITNAG
jgi:retron-type reverse transcriptase